MKPCSIPCSALDSTSSRPLSNWGGPWLFKASLAFWVLPSSHCREIEGEFILCETGEVLIRAAQNSVPRPLDRGRHYTHGQGEGPCYNWVAGPDQGKGAAIILLACQFLPPFLQRSGSFFLYLIPHLSLKSALRKKFTPSRPGFSHVLWSEPLCPKKPASRKEVI